MPNHKGFRRQLSVSERQDIQARYLAGEEVADLKAAYGCAASTIGYVVRGLVSARHRAAYLDATKRFSALRVEDVHWSAGIVDGEGWVGIGRNGTFNGPRVSVSSADAFMTPALHALFGGSLCVKPKIKPARDQMCWDLWTLTEVRAFCEVVGKHLRVKHQQALILAEYCKSRMHNKLSSYTESETGLVKQLTSLNKKGRE